MELSEDHIYLIHAVDPLGAFCDGEDDPQNPNCWVKELGLLGDEDGVEFVDWIDVG